MSNVNMVQVERAKLAALAEAAGKASAAMYTALQGLAGWRLVLAKANRELDAALAAAREPAPVERECPAVLAVCAECDEPLAVGANLDAECNIEARVSRCDCKPAPVEEGDVVERAAKVAREAYQRSIWSGQTFGTTSIDSWLVVIRALHAAGLLAGAVTWERLVEIQHEAVAEFTRRIREDSDNIGTLHVSHLVADAILREIGGGR